MREWRIATDPQPALGDITTQTHLSFYSLGYITKWQLRLFHRRQLTPLYDTTLRGSASLRGRPGCQPDPETTRNTSDWAPRQNRDDLDRDVFFLPDECHIGVHLRAVIYLVIESLSIPSLPHSLIPSRPMLPFEDLPFPTGRRY